MLEKEIKIDKIEILEDGTIQARESTRILEDGVIISSKNTNRFVIHPGSDLSAFNSKIQDIGAIVHKKEVIEKYNEKRTKNELKAHN